MVPSDSIHGVYLLGHGLESSNRSRRNLLCRAHAQRGDTEMRCAAWVPGAGGTREAGDPAQGGETEQPVAEGGRCSEGVTPSTSTSTSEEPALARGPGIADVSQRLSGPDSGETQPGPEVDERLDNLKTNKQCGLPPAGNRPFPGTLAPEGPSRPAGQAVRTRARTGREGQKPKPWREI